MEIAKIMPKPTQSKRDKYLLKRYGITDVEYQTMLAEQNGKCKICGKEPTGRPLHVDHWHALRYYKTKTVKQNNIWTATPNNDINPIKFNLSFTGKTKSEALKALRLALLRLSVRGLICWRDNALLQQANDNPLVLKSAAR
jgi:hypothetical protein